MKKIPANSGQTRIVIFRKKRVNEYQQEARMEVETHVHLFSKKRNPVLNEFLSFAC